MIERGRDAVVQAMVMRWMRRVAGAGDSAPGARRKDDIFPGRVFNPNVPAAGVAAEPPPPALPAAPFATGPTSAETPAVAWRPADFSLIPPGGEGPGATPAPSMPFGPIPPGGEGPGATPAPSMPFGPIPPGGEGPGANPAPSAPFGPNQTGEIVVVVPEQADAVLGAVLEHVSARHRVYEHEQDDLQPVFRFGSASDFFQVRGTANVAPTLAVSESSESLPPNLAWFWSRWQRYTDVRVATATNDPEVGLWIGASFAGSTVSGYLGVLGGSGRLRIYRVDNNAETELAASAPIDAVAYRLEFQRVGNTLVLKCTTDVVTVISASDATYGAGYVGFGSLTGDPGATYDGFEVTQPA